MSESNPRSEWQEYLYKEIGALLKATEQNPSILSNWQRKLEAEEAIIKAHKDGVGSTQSILNEMNGNPSMQS